MLRFVAEVLFRTACMVSGHGVLWAATIGRWRPSWHKDVPKPTTDRDNVAALVGVLCWSAVGARAWFLFFRHRR